MLQIHTYFILSTVKEYEEELKLKSEHRAFFEYQSEIGAYRSKINQVSLQNTPKLLFEMFLDFWENSTKEL